MSWLPAKTDAEQMPKRIYRDRASALRLELLEMQTRLRGSPLKAVVLFCGVDGAGKGEVVNLLNKWLDPHWIRSRAFDAPSDEESERPPFWRFWRALPGRGEMALLLSAWYSEPLLERVRGRDAHWLEQRLERIRRFERMLDLDEYVILKFWLHLDREAQERRLRALEGDPLLHWRVSETDWHNWSRYDRFVEATEELLEGTHSDASPWIVVDGSDPRRRDLAVGEALLAGLKRRLTGGGAENLSVSNANGPEGTAETGRDGSVDERRSGGSRALDPDEYRRKRRRLQAELNQLHHRARRAGTSLVSVFEGRDAAGKGGAIWRLVPAFDARVLDVVRVGPPTEEELSHHYLWRFWRRLPRAGGVTLFDRSWYGRVLVERVEGLVEEDGWRRAYDEINDFELQMVEHGTVILKCWLEVSREEQALRFEERKRIPHKRWKLTEDDLHSRALWDEYDAAVRDMLKHTSTSHAPWLVVPADDKRRARIHVLKAACRTLSRQLGGAGSLVEAPETAAGSRAERRLRE